MAARNRQRKGKRYFRDLRDFIAQLEQTGNLHRITDRIEKNSELMPLVRWQYQGLLDDQRKAFLFDNVTDPEGKSYDCRVAVGVLGASRAIYKLALGLNEKSEAGEVAERWNQALSHPIKPRSVKSGPVKEVILKGKDISRTDGGLLRFPVPISNPGFDGGPFLTAPYVVTKDPDTGVPNVGTYRCMIKGSNKSRRQRFACTAYRHPLSQMQGEKSPFAGGHRARLQPCHRLSERR